MSEQNSTQLESKKTISKPMIFILFSIILLIVFSLIWKYIILPKQKLPEVYNSWQQPVPVRVVPLVRADLQLELKAVGSAIPTQSVTLQSQVSGILKALYFKDGDMVKKGQLLVQIDPAAFQVALSEALGEQQQHLAELHYAQSELQRKQRMLKQDAISKQEFDQQLAQVNQLKGQSQALQSRVDAAKLELSYSKIYAPISGRAGFRLKDVGNLIQANDSTGLVSITQTSPIYVEFAIAENYLDVLQQSLQQKQQLIVEAWDREERKRLATGTVYALDNQIDVQSGTLKIKAIFDNADQKLFANQFLNVRLQAQTIHDAVTVPSDAIQHGAKDSYVYVIDQNNKAQIRKLQLGLTANDKTQVLSGLQGNEKVVLEGIDRLNEGREVRILAQNEGL